MRKMYRLMGLSDEDLGRGFLGLGTAEWALALLGLALWIAASVERVG